MACIAILVCGIVLDAAAFIGGNYPPRALGGGYKAAQEGKVRHDKTLEAYQAAIAKYMRDRTKLLDWIATIAELKEQPNRNSPASITPLTQRTQVFRLLPPNRAAKTGRTHFCGRGRACS